MDKLLMINNTSVPTPSEYSVGVQDISKAERLASGKMVIERIATKVKLELSWRYLTSDQLQTLLKSVEGSKASPTFPVKYWDPTQKKTLTSQFYVGDRQAGMLMYKNGMPVYVDANFNLIEV